MATFQYARKDGSLGTIDAPDADSAIRMLPADADPHSGVMSVLSGTGTPAPAATAPVSAPLPGATSTLPSSSGDTGNLIAFKDALSQVGNLARSQRESLMQAFMQPFQGTVRASDFSQLQDTLAGATDTTMQDYVKNRIAPESKAPDYKLVTNDNGDVTALDPATGQVVWVQKGVGNKQTGKEPKDTTAKDKANDIATAILDFKSQMETKGWTGAKPEAYKYYRDQLINLYGASAALELDKAMQEQFIPVDNGN